MRGWVCQLGDGYMLYGKGNHKYRIVKTGYPYPDLDHTNVDGLCEVFGERNRDRIQGNAKEYMDAILSRYCGGAEFDSLEIIGKVGSNNLYYVGLVKEKDGWLLFYADEKVILGCKDLFSHIEGYKSGDGFILVHKDIAKLWFRYRKSKGKYNVSDTIFSFGVLSSDNVFLFGKLILNASNIYHLAAPVLLRDYVNRNYGGLSTLESESMFSYPDSLEVAYLCGVGQDVLVEDVARNGIMDRHVDAIDVLCKSGMWRALILLFYKKNSIKLQDRGSEGVVYFELPKWYRCLVSAEKTELDKNNANWLFKYCYQESKDNKIYFNLLNMCGRKSLIRVVKDFCNRLYKQIKGSAEKSYLDGGAEAFYGYLTDSYDIVMAKCEMLDTRGMIEYRHTYSAKWVASYGVKPLINYLAIGVAKDDGSEFQFDEERRALCERMYIFKYIPSILLSYIDAERLILENEEDLIALGLNLFLRKTTVSFDRGAIVSIDDVLGSLGMKNFSQDLWWMKYELNGKATFVDVYYGGKGNG